MKTSRHRILAVLALSLTLSLAACGNDNDTPPASPPSTYTIGGLVSGYTGTGLVLQNNGTDALLVSTGSTSFTFAAKIAQGSPYSVTVSTQPTGTTPYQTCAVTNGNGTVPAGAVTSVVVTCTTSSWDALATLPLRASFTDFTPAEQSGLYFGYDTSFNLYTFPTATAADGYITARTAPSTGIGAYIGLAWIGNLLYTTQTNSVHVYDINGDSWSSPAVSLPHDHTMSQTTADDSGYIYSLATSTTALLKFNTADNSFAYITAPSNILSGAHEPRAAWDSRSQRVYLADFYRTAVFYAFDPTNGNFTLLAPHPSADGFPDAFCSDRRGRIFTSDRNATRTVWMYTAATDSWTSIGDLPFDIGDSSACSVSADGWLYMSNGNTGDFARFKVF